jgi:protein-L-isoaspartate O-methyltransferase
VNALNQDQEHQQEPAQNLAAREGEQGRAEPEYIGTGTYSPDDNKLRLYPFARLDRETYERVKAAGFKWAPKQEIFVAPMWTPLRADLLAELCGDLEDEDKSLTERAEERAERFDDYSGKRAREANRAHESVSAIADNIPLGQPILIGHHSEKRARKDAARIENGMRRAVKLWDTSNYWKARAAGALHHAKYKELPAVRHRRVKGLEADKRKQERTRDESRTKLALWLAGDLDHAKALRIANFDSIHVRQPGKEWPASLWSLLEAENMTVAEASATAVKHHNRVIAYAERWIAHYEFRLSYERAMLGDAGGIASDRFDIQPGGRVLVGGEWLVVIRVNKSGGQVVSVTTNSRYVRCKGIESVKDYQPPAAGDVEKVKAATKLPPMANFPGEGFIEMTAAEWKRKAADYKGTRKAAATATHGAYRYRTAFAPGGGYRLAPVYITDQKRVDPPAADSSKPVALEIERVVPAARPAALQAEPTAFDAMRDQLRQGVQVVTAPQLFPTPADLAARMASLAELSAGYRVLEPSAGTGVLLAAVRADEPGAILTAVEIDYRLSDRLRRDYDDVRQADFLACGEELGRFDAVLMNPPFAEGIDITHIRHAFGMLKPGGVLVAICANGPRQNDQLRPLVEQTGGEWEDLPDGTFKNAGTSVRTALITLRAA